MQLRGYQRECLERIFNRYRKGRRRMLVSLPTGTGKTVIFAQFPSFFSMKRRLLVLAHRQELLEQAHDKFRAIDPGLSVGIEQAGRRASDAQVVIASVPSLRGRRLETLDPEQFYLVVVDEAHHAVAPSYRAIFEHLRIFEPGTRKLLVGFTATPRRADRRGLNEIFEEIAFSKTTEEMIASGFLCPVAGWRVRTDVSLDQVGVQRGDFAESQLAGAVNTTARNDLIVAAHQRFAARRRCIVFCVNVAHAQQLADDFARAGLRSAAVWGAMPLQERKAVIRRLKDATLDVVTNCNVLTEGFDEPSVDCVIMARPTMSMGLYAQMIGRGTRLYPGKRDLLVIDIADNSRRHRLAGLNALFGLPPDFDLKGGKVLPISQRMQRMAHSQPWVDLSQLQSVEDLELAAERIEFFRLEPPEQIASVAQFTWLSAGEGFRLELPDATSILIERDLLGKWEVRARSAGQPETEPIASAASAQQAVVEAEKVIAQRFHDAVLVVRRDAAWRKLSPTERQLEILESKRVPIPPGLTRGQASWLLSYALRRAPR